MALDDPYEGLCVHGTLPLVRDPGSPVGVQFAYIGLTPPEDCIRDASELPQCDISLHVFATKEERSGYARALADFGDNAISFLASEPMNPAPLIGLLVRHDRERHLSGSLNDAIRLVSAPNDLAVSFSRRRQHDLKHFRDRDVYEDWKRRWAPELSTMRTIPGHMMAGPSNGDDWVDFFLMGKTREALRLIRIDGQHSVTWDPKLAWLDDATREAVLAAADERGLVRLDDGRLGSAPGAFGQEMLDAFAAAANELRAIMDEAQYDRPKASRRSR